MSKNTLLSELINYISANSSGNVVIAAPSSGYALDVTGTGRFTGDLTLANTSANNRLFINRASSAYTNGIFYQTNGTYDFLLGQNPLGTGTSDLSIYNYGTSSVVFNIARSTGAATFSSSVTASGLIQANSTGQAFKLLSLDTTGSYITFSPSTGSDYGYIGSNYHLTGSGSASDLAIRATANLIFDAGGGTERMRITSGGNVLIGKTSDNGYPLQVNGTISVVATYGLSKASTGAYLPMYMNGTLYYLLIYA